jgi:hypothetical protein
MNVGDKANRLPGNHVVPPGSFSVGDRAIAVRTPDKTRLFSGSANVGDRVKVLSVGDKRYIISSGLSLPSAEDSIRRIFSGYGDYLYEWLVVYQSATASNLKHYLIKRDMNSATLRIISAKSWPIPATEITGSGPYIVDPGSYYADAGIMAAGTSIYWNSIYPAWPPGYPPGYQPFDRTAGLFGDWTAYPNQYPGDPDGYQWPFTQHMAMDSTGYYSCQTKGASPYDYVLTKHSFADDSLLAESPALDPYVHIAVGRAGGSVFAYGKTATPLYKFVEYDPDDLSLVTNYGNICTPTSTYWHIYGGDLTGDFVLVGSYSWSGGTSYSTHSLTIKKLDIGAGTCAALTVDPDTAS